MEEEYLNGIKINKFVCVNFLEKKFIKNLEQV